MMRAFKIAALLLVLVLISLPAAAEEPKSFEGLTITSVTLENTSAARDRDIMRLFRLKEGDRYSSPLIADSIKLISRMPTIGNLAVSRRADADGVALSLVVVPTPLVREILFPGMDFLEEKYVRTRLRTMVDNPIYGPFLESDKEKILELYKAEGYNHAEVSVRLERTKNLLWINALFEVKEHSPSTITAYGDMGDIDTFGRAESLKLLGLSKGHTASPRRLREGVEKLLAEVRSRSYPEATAYDARFEELDGEVIMSVPLNLGDQIKFTITGGDKVTPSELDDLLKSRFGEEVNETWLRLTAQALQDEAVKLGYPLARVAWEKGEDNGLTRVTFRVKLGTCAKVEKVLFTGNNSVDEDDLRDRMPSVSSSFFGRPRYVRTLLEKDLPAIEGYYASKGMVRARANIEEERITPEGDVYILIQVEEGSVYHFGAPRFNTDAAMDEGEAKTLAGISEGDEAVPGALDRARIAILSALSKRGHVNASVKYRTLLDEEQKRVYVNFDIVGGEAMRFGPVVISGNARTRSEVIARELTFNSGELWNQEEILLSQRAIFDLGFFSDVRINTIPPTGETHELPVVVEVTERDVGRIDYGIGYGSQEGLLAFAEIGHSNIKGTGRSASARVEKRGNDHAAFLNFKEPWLFGYPYDMRLRFAVERVERESYTLDATSFQVSIDHDFNKRLTGTILYTLEDNSLIDVDPEAVVYSFDDEAYLLSAIGPVLIYDSRDDPFNPRHGYRLSGEAQWALEQLGSEVYYSRYEGSASSFFSLDRVTLATMVRAGFSDPIGITESLPINKRFFLGGRNTVRGFKFESIGPKADDGTPLGGDLMVNLKAEIRFPLFSSLGGALFWDAGQVWLKDKEQVDILGDIRQAVGFGFRYNTPVGPLALDFGFKLDKQEDESPSEWHFTIGSVF